MELSEVISKLEKLPNRLQVSAAHQIANDMRGHMHQYMMTPDGVSYPQLTPAYKSSKIRAGYGGDPNLKRTGEYGRGIQPRKEGEDIIVAPKDSDMPRAEGLSKKRPHIGVPAESPGLIEASWDGILERL